LRGKIDVISFECGEVSTKLLGNRKGFGVITPPRATWGCLRDLGTFGVTNGAFRHEFMMSIMPSFVMQYAVNAASRKVLERYRQKQASEKSN
jgi:hypothetical protein